jgi:hypothetical protein
MKQYRTPEEEMVEFCDKIKPGRFAFMGELHTVKDGINLFGFVVKSSLINNGEKYLPSAELPKNHTVSVTQRPQPRLYRDTILAVFQKNGTLATKEVAAVITREAAIQINPLLQNGNICLEVSCDCPPTFWESRMIIPKDVASYEAQREIVLL